MLWKPIITTIGVLIFKEAGVYVCRKAANKLYTDRLRSKVREKLNVIRRDFKRDDRGRFTRNDEEGR